MLKLLNVTKSFMNRGVVLDELDLSVGEADTIAVAGPSGSGKTTLLNLVGLLDRPDSGEILFRDESILGYDNHKAAIYRNSNIGFVFQDHLLLAHLTIYENILLPLLASKSSDDEYQESESYAFDLMKSVGIEGIAGKFPYQVSGGEAQRAALVRALVRRPSLILADEPTGALDSGNAQLLGDLLLDLNRQSKIAIMVVTHSPKLAERMNRRHRLEAGRLVEF